LDGLHSGVFTFSTDPGVLFDALLSRAGAAAGIGRAERTGRSRRMAAYVPTRRALRLWRSRGSAILWMVRGVPTPRYAAPDQRADVSVYTLRWGTCPILTCRAFAYLRLPLAVAGIASRSDRGSVVAARRGTIPAAALTAMMILFFHAARLALVVFDPYMSSPAAGGSAGGGSAGTLIVDDQYYTFSSVFSIPIGGRCCSTAGEQPGLRILCAGRAEGTCLSTTRGFQHCDRARALLLVVEARKCSGWQGW